MKQVSFVGVRAKPEREGHGPYGTVPARAGFVSSYEDHCMGISGIMLEGI